MKTWLMIASTALLIASCSSMGKKEAACSCDHKCTEACHQGKEKKDCDCKACECSKTGSCSQHQCGEKKSQ